MKNKKKTPHKKRTRKTGFFIFLRLITRPSSKNIVAILTGCRDGRELTHRAVELLLLFFFLFLNIIISTCSYTHYHLLSLIEPNYHCRCWNSEVVTSHFAGSLLRLKRLWCLATVCGIISHVQCIVVSVMCSER